MIGHGLSLLGFDFSGPLLSVAIATVVILGMLVLYAWGQRK